VPCAAAACEDVAALLAERVPAAAAGAEIRDGEVVLWIPVEQAEAVLGAVRAEAGRLRDAGIAVQPEQVLARPALPEQEWRDAWKRHFHTVRLTRQILVVPSWEQRPQPADDDVIIDLDPGQAFGTGAHASTRLLLEAEQALRDEGHAVRRFLDVGTGSAILAIAAAKLWPESTGWAIDVDPLAVDVAAENCAINRVGARVQVAATPLHAVEGPFDLVCANIQQDVLLALRTELAARVAPGGALLLSGLLADQAAGVAREFAGCPGLELVGVTPSAADPEWSAVRLRRPR
jgi:ribosomal protein L11 methyltransferase